MRTSKSVIVSLLLSTVTAISSPADAQSQQTPPGPKAEKGKTAQRPLTSSEQSRESLQGAVTSPLRDVT